MDDQNGAKQSISEIASADEIEGLFNQLGFGFSSVCYLLVAILGKLNQYFRKTYNINNKLYYTFASSSSINVLFNE